MLKKTIALSSKNIEKYYIRWMYINMLVTLGCFSFAVERAYLIFPLYLLVTVGFLINKPLSNKIIDALASVLLIAIFALIYTFTQGDTLFSAGGILIGSYFLFFFREKNHQKSAVNLLTILGMMLLCTSLLNRFEYLVFFILFVFSSMRLLYYSLLFQQELAVCQVISQRPVTYRNSLKTTFVKLVIVLISVVVAVTVFILVPRSHKWEFATSGQLNIGKTGFSGKIASSSVRNILSDPNVFFVVQTKNTSDYFKGAIYNRFDGSNWHADLPTKNIRFRGYLEINPSVKNMVAEVYKFNNSPGETIFYRNTPYVLKSSNFRTQLIIDEVGNISSKRKFKKSFTYFLLTGPKIKKKWDPKWINQHFLQLPNISQRVHNLAQEITEGLSGSRKKAQAIEDYLKGNYPYTLNMNPGKNEVSDYFLFEAKRGYCIHFATAMTVMLRSVGVPARVVGGFRSGKYEKGHAIVSNEDAHAWVEVFDERQNWVFFDPTPPQSDYLIGLSYWKKIYYKIYAFWTLDVLGFSYSQQKSVYTYVKSLFLSAKKYWWVLVVLLIMYSSRTSLYKKRKQKTLTKQQRDALIDKSPHAIANSFYQNMLSILGKVNCYKYIEETPFDFLARIEHQFPQYYETVKNISTLFCEIRFGHVEFCTIKQQIIKNNIAQMQKIVENQLECTDI
ncbi:transglutaminaseTgpA domain-containing protein [Candidatus Uabimicrobium sp. HlEnr_7]|uniref:transglutaminase family protein n=1 Tax=Candidatus Uabimicrobium helgolandensis TaxID=3095367 RepID=UPI0035585886